MQTAIIGAGFTGSYLAFRLSQAGHDVEVFDKARGRGGRCTTKRMEWGQFDMGAPVMPVKSNAFSHLLGELQQHQVAAHWQVEAADYEQQLRAANRDHAYWVFTPGMSSACHHWLSGIRLHTQCLVKHLQKLRQGWMIWCEDERRFGTYDNVIVTVPLPQALPLLSEHLDASELPDARWSACWTVALAYGQPVKGVPELVYSRSRDIQTLVNDSAKPGRDSSLSVWVAYLSHQASEGMLEQDKQQIRDHVIHQLSGAFDGVFSEPIHCYAHRWRFARPARGEKPGGIIAGREADGLYALGDWTAGASVESAWLAAEQFLSDML